MASTSMAEIYTQVGDEQNAKRHMKDAIDVKDRSTNVNPEILVDMAGACLKLSMGEAADSLISEVIEKTNDRKLMGRIDQICTEAGIVSPMEKKRADIAQMVLKIGKDAVALVGSGDLDGAYAKFFEAVSLDPENQRGVLNCVIMITKILLKQGVDGKLITEGRNLLIKAKKINQDNEQFKKVRTSWDVLEKKLETNEIIY